jgi:aarF domain-containing kinase
MLMIFKMTNRITGVISSSKVHRQLLGFTFAALNCRGQMTSNFKRCLFTGRAIKPRHIIIGVASVTVAAGAVVSVGLAGLAVSGAHGAVFSSQGNNDSHSSSTVVANEHSLPTEYNISAIQAYWRSRPTEVLLRMAEVTLAFAPYLTKLFLWEYWMRRKIRNHEGLQQKYAVQLREILTKLGPCFIKFGQALSIRPDILPSIFLLELQKLCDAVPPFPTKDAIDMIDDELGKGSASKIFKELHPGTMPIAAASLGQVYKLRLKEVSPNDKKRGIKCNEDERWVAVKVQRPDMIQSILKDLFIMRILAGVIEKKTVTITNQQPYNVALLDTFAAASLEELNYIKEAEHQERFRMDLVPLLGGKIYVPVVYHEFTTRKVIVSEWVEGEKLASSNPDVVERLTKVGIECFLTQLLVTGVFHADPHPGNLLVTKDGNLALIDFGLCANVPLPDTKTLTLAIVHLMQRDVNGLILDAINLGFLPKDVDIKRLQVDLQGVFDGSQIVQQIFKNPTDSFNDVGKYLSIVSRRKQFWAVSKELNKIFFNYPFLVPDYFSLMTRAMIVLEGIAVTGNPEFDIFAESYPYAFKIALKTFKVSDLSEIAKEIVIAHRKQT